MLAVTGDEQDVRQRQGAEWSYDALVELRRQGGAFEGQLLGRAQARVQVLGHALELLRQRGDLELAGSEPTADGGGKEAGQGRRTAHEAREALGRQAPDDALGERRERGGAALVAQQRQVAEHRRRLEDVELHAIGETLDQSFTQDVQRVGARALGEDHLVRLEVHFFQCRREPRTVDWR